MWRKAFPVDHLSQEAFWWRAFPVDLVMPSCEEDESLSPSVGYYVILEPDSTYIQHFIKYFWKLLIHVYESYRQIYRF